ncbi:phosphatase PAP2 family protein [Arthrobacter sp. B6]|uniref:phosphatase PAP2 family protein n=1 Tax=Arthrobacter sp. B6 TaxID=1570137 RepID=UPI00083161BA|nr:phosphatase PAP2 family protein [Arthrobacter sp. B6]
MDKHLKEGMPSFMAHCAAILLTLALLGLGIELVAPLQGAAVSSGPSFINVLGGAANFLAEIAGQVGWLILPMTVLWLLIRGIFTSALYVATVALGMVFLSGGGILLLAFAALITDGTSGDGNLFSSGSMQLTVISGVLLLVFLPAVPAKGRPWAVIGTAAPVIGFEIIRILAEAVPPGPILGGWLIGLAWLGASFRAFRRWQQQAGPWPPWWRGLPAQDRAARVPAPVRDPTLPGGRSSALKLASIWVLLAGGVTGAGFLITAVLASVQRMDHAVVQWLAEHRNDALNVLASVAGSFGTTAGIVGVLLVAAPLAMAITRRAAPAAFLLVAVTGETALYLVTGMIVSRARPDVEHLSEGLPPTSSFPSGHVAAAVVMYGGLALLLRAWTQSRLRNLGLILAPLLVLGVALSRLYWGVHYPTDTAVSLMFGTAWVFVCWRYFQPARGAPKRTTRHAGTSS